MAVASQSPNIIRIIQDSPAAERLPSPSEDELGNFDENSSTDGEASTASEVEERQPPLDWATVARANAEDGFPEVLDIEQTEYFGPPQKKLRHSKSYKELYEGFMAAKAIRESPGLQPIPPFPAIQCSASHMRLMNVPSAKTPHFFCASALKQMLPRTLERSHMIHMDRLNMMQYIPELGIVIIATQMGRCAVCTLTKKTDTGTMGFRVDWILPTKEQERQGLRPPVPLLGIAAGPIQGRQIGEENNTSNESYSSLKSAGFSSSPSSSSETSVPPGGNVKQARERPQSRKRPNRPGVCFLSHPLPKAESWHGLENSRRYRLMLTYYDQTVMTYELWQEAPNIGIDGRKNWRNRPNGMV
jgi:hypothetical protein